MKFFNQKEEVINLELTQYGKRMLSLGKFKPVHYAFFDKDILYNSQCSIGAEEQNDAEGRIKTGTPRMKPQHNFIGVETQYLEMRSIITGKTKFTDKEKVEHLQDTENKFFNLDFSLGTTKLKSVYQPSWKLNFYSENLVSASMAITSSVLSNKSIPQLEATLSYNTFVISNKEASNIQEGNSLVGLEPGDIGAHGDLPLSEYAEGDHNNILFDDGSAIIVKDDFLLIGIEEENTNFFKENFELEIFIIEPKGGGAQKLIPLYFSDVDEDEPFIDDTANAEYFFNIAVDDKIPQNVLCSLVPLYTKRNLYLKDIFHCEDILEENTGFGNIYEDDDLGDPC